MFELTSLLSSLSLYKKVYDSTADHSEDEILMYCDINFDDHTNRVYYSQQTMTKVKELLAGDFKIYVDEYADFRKIILSVNGVC
jgi:hypothetical protein